MEVAKCAQMPLLMPPQQWEEHHTEEKAGGICVAQAVGHQAIHCKEKLEEVVSAGAPLFEEGP